MRERFAVAGAGRQCAPRRLLGRSARPLNFTVRRQGFTTRRKLGA